MRLVFLFLAGIFFVSFASALIPGDCDYSMEAFWKMDLDATDSSGEGHHGIGWPGGVYVLKNGNAVGFDGTSRISVLEIGDLFRFGFTIEMWIQKDGAPVGNGTLFRKGDYVIEYLDDNTIKGSVGGVSVASGVLSVDTPYYVALTWEPTSKSLALYVDGSSVDSAELVSPSVYMGSVYMGEGFIGLMDEVAVYARTFDAGDINLHYVLSDADKDYCDESGVNGSSTTKSDFNIAGCSLPTGEGLAIDSCSRREADGEYYCDSDTTLWETREIGLGCSMGLDSGSWNLGDPFCCPAGMFCNATGGAFKCDYRLEQCYDKTDEASCEAIGCVWLDEEGICADGTRDYGCSLYQNQAECLSDVWNLGRTGIGTEFCGEYVECAGELYTIPYESCGCEWNSGSGACELYMEATETYYSNESLKKWFSCFKDYTIGECIDGDQDVSWNASSVIYNGFPAICLDVIGCSDGSSVRVCGEPVVKLPGFSFFSLIASVIVIGLYYARREYLVKVGRFK